MKHVQFSDDTLTAVIKVFGGPQDPEAYPNQASVEDDDPRFVAYTDRKVGGLVRGKRTALLSDCDWTEMPGSPLSDAKKAEWATYRQELRDITTQSGFPNTVTWPTKPA